MFSNPEHGDLQTWLEWNNLPAALPMGMHGQTLLIASQAQSKEDRCITVVDQFMDPLVWSFLLNPRVWFAASCRDNGMAPVQMLGS